MLLMQVARVQSLVRDLDPIMSQLRPNIIQYIIKKKKD